ncbi:ROK family transcriptional regulator [Solihabitans fulvus]|uniref:ROK family transcriptional regulator n=1 Tax=Solihabitans fulvus TaxID=1892852 RepID=A0A5B2X0A2_9PSEU|nr:ROK family transcriptional regulator [Solihabitans fulvus]KAA2256714.1 ROK family transcriptional regulator [Solihabitans fulvus]
MAATPRVARTINDRLALDLLLDRGPLTAAQLREHTGLSQPSVGDLVERLSAAGLITVVGEAGERRRGPNARLYGIVADRAHVAGIDARRDSVTMAIADLTGDVVATLPLPMDRAGEPATVMADAVAAAVEHAGIAPDTLHTVVIGTPGLVDPISGDVNLVTTLPAWRPSLASELRERLGRPVVLENEVNLAAIAEHRLGVARGRDDFALLWLDRAVGGAVVLGGELRRGASGGAGEFGYFPVTGPDGEPRTFHDSVNAEEVAELARAHGQPVPRTENQDGVPECGLPAGLVASVADVAAAVRSGGDAFLDALAARVAVGVLGLCALLDPGFVVLAGDLGRAGGDALAGRVADRVASAIPLRTEVRATTVDGNPVLRGALLTALADTRDALF